MNLSIQKIEGYPIGYYLLVGGPEPRVVTVGQITQSLQKLVREVDIQRRILGKIEQMQLPRPMVPQVPVEAPPELKTLPFPEVK